MTKATTLDLVALAKSVGENLGECNEAENRAAALKESMNKSIAALHNAKAKVGTFYKDRTSPKACALATAFVDGCIAKGIKESTAQKTYLPTFKAHVASGKPVNDWNMQRAKKAKGAKAEGTGKSLAQKLATVYRDDGFAEFCQALQDSFEGAECDSLHEGIESYLILNGALKEDEGK
jgi:hypothetical protein